MPGKKVIIVGGGVFGISTALAYSKRFPNDQILVLDRYELPCPDGSSVDSSRIVRADYASQIYSDLMMEAFPIWLNDPQLSKHFYKSGLLLLGEEQNSYVENSMKNVQNTAKEFIEPIQGGLKGMRDRILGKENNRDKPHPENDKWRGYVNKMSGWAHAENSVRVWAQRAKEQKNVKIMVGQVSNLLYQNSSADSPIRGVQLKDGRTFEGDLVVLATGAWSPQFIDLEGRCLATGQALAYMKISPEEEKSLSKAPVTLDLTTGCFFIPPKDGELKIARHAMGYFHPQSVPHWNKQGENITVSIPRTNMTHPNEKLPREAEECMRSWMRDFLPEFAERPFSSTRICWYSDTPTGDFIISYHPSHKGLFVATGGSGHGFKFLPILGEKIVDAIEGKLEHKYASKWKWPIDIVPHKSDGSRGRGSVLDLTRLLQEQNPDIKNREMHSVPKLNSKL